MPRSSSFARALAEVLEAVNDALYQHDHAPLENVIPALRRLIQSVLTDEQFDGQLTNDIRDHLNLILVDISLYER